MTLSEPSFQPPINNKGACRRALASLSSDRHRAWVLCVTNAAILQDERVAGLLEKQREAQIALRDAMMSADPATLSALKDSVHNPARPDRTMDEFEAEMAEAMLVPDWWSLADCLVKNRAALRRLWDALVDRIDDLAEAQVAALYEAVLDASLELAASGSVHRA
jgi:hypothetical protein